MTVARPDIAAGLPVRRASTKCVLQTAQGETPPHIKDSFRHTDSWAAPTENLVFVANITDELNILGHDVLRARDAAVDLKCLVLQLAKRTCHCGARWRNRVHPM
jgi:hypothetical protein